MKKGARRHVIIKTFFSHSHFVQCLLLYAFIKDEYNERSFMLILKMHFVNKKTKMPFEHGLPNLHSNKPNRNSSPGHLNRQNW